MARSRFAGCEHRVTRLKHAMARFFETSNAVVIRVVQVFRKNGRAESTDSRIRAVASRLASSCYHRFAPTVTIN